MSQSWTDWWYGDEQKFTVRSLNIAPLRTPISDAAREEIADNVDRSVYNNLASVLNDPFEESPSAEPFYLPAMPDALAGVVPSERELLAIIRMLPRALKKIQPPISASEQHRTNIRALETCLQTVPSEYFDPQFSLNRKLTELFAQDGIKSFDEQSGELQIYVDLVERTLFAQISSRRHSFLSALKTVSSLQVEVHHGLLGIKMLRREIRRVHKTFIRSKLRLIHMENRRRNARKVQHLLELIDTVRGTPQTVNILLGGKDFAGALHIIATTRTLLKTELAGVKCMSRMHIRLNELTIKVDKFMVHEFLLVASPGEVAVMENDSDGDAYLLSIVASIHARGHLHTLAQTYQDHLSAQAKSQLTETVFKCLDEFKRDQEQKQTLSDAKSDTDTRGRSDRHDTDASDSARKSDSGGGENMGARFEGLTEHEFTHLFLSITTTINLLMKRAAHVVQLITHAVNLIGTDGDDVFGAKAEADLKAIMSVPMWMRQTSDVYRAVLTQFVQYCHAKVAKIVSTRPRAHAQLTAAQFVALTGHVSEFVEQGEQLLLSFDDAKASTRLLRMRAVLTKQGKAMLAQFHTSQVQAVASALESEKWKRSTVPKDIQKLVNSSLVLSSSQGSSTTSSTLEDKSEQHKLYVDVLSSDTKTKERAYFAVVPSALIMLRSFAEYLRISTMLPALANEVVNRLTELLKLVNSRTCQLVLGAGAMQLAGLESITATHLALACALLGLVRTQIVVMKQALGVTLPLKHAVLLGVFDRVAMDYENHQTEVLQKIVSIVEDRIDATRKGLKGLTWVRRLHDTANPVMNDKNTPAQISVETSIRVLMKQISSLHNTLADLLPATSLLRVFDAVGVLLLDMVRKTFGTDLLRIKSSTVIRDKVSINVSHIIMRLRSLHSFRDENKIVDFNVYV